MRCIKGYDANKFGDYIIIDKIRENKYFEVFKAKKTGIENFEKIVMLKKILPCYRNNKTIRRFFINEARVLSSCKHINFPEIYEFDKVENELFLTTEFIKGVSLVDFLKNHKRNYKKIPLKISILIVKKILNFLLYFHGLKTGGLQVRLKTDSIFISNTGMIKIPDFEIPDKNFFSFVFKDSRGIKKSMHDVGIIFCILLTLNQSFNILRYKKYINTAEPEVPYEAVKIIDKLFGFEVSADDNMIYEILKDIDKLIGIYDLYISENYFSEYLKNNIRSKTENIYKKTTYLYVRSRES